MTSSTVFSAIRGALIALTVLAVSYGFSRWIKSANEKAEQATQGLDYVTVKMPKLYRWVGYISVVFFLGLAVVMTLTAGEDFSFFALWIFLFFAILGLPLLIATYLWRIDVVKNADTFIYHTSFGRTYEVRYDEIQYYDIRMPSQQVILKTAERKYYVDLNSTNLGAFTDELTFHQVKERESSGI